jgi:hypothetical protein
MCSKKKSEFGIKPTTPAVETSLSAGKGHVKYALTYQIAQ